MAAVTHEAVSASTSNVSTYASAAFSPAVGDLLVVSVVSSGTVDAGDVTVSANGVSSFTPVDRAIFGPTIHSVYIFVADQLTTGTASMTVTFDCTGDAATGAIVMVAAVSGMTKTGATAILQSTKIDDGAGGTAPTFTFGASCLTGNVTIYAIGEISTAGMLTPTNWTQGAQTSYSTPTIGGSYGYRASGFTGTTVTWPGNETAHGGVFVELDTSSSGTPATFSTTVGDADAAGGSATFTGAATFSTTVGDTDGAGGSTSLTGAALFATLVGDTAADGGSTTFTGAATFTTTAGDSAGDGGSSTLTGEGLFTSTAGDATAEGGVSTFSAGGSPATFTTTVGDAAAAGGSSTFTGAALFATVAGDVDAAGGSTSFFGAALFATSAGDAIADGGLSTLTGAALFSTAAGAATADGAASSFVGAALFGTTVGDAAGGGGTTSLTGAALFLTVAGDATGDGGSTSFVVTSDQAHVLAYITRLIVIAVEHRHTQIAADDRHITIPREHRTITVDADTRHLEHPAETRQPAAT